MARKQTDMFCVHLKKILDTPVFCKKKNIMNNFRSTGFGMTIRVFGEYITLFSNIYYTLHMWNRWNESEICVFLTGLLSDGRPRNLQPIMFSVCTLFDRTSCFISLIWSAFFTPTATRTYVFTPHSVSQEGLTAGLRA